jgi:hypothetical protein
MRRRLARASTIVTSLLVAAMAVGFAALRGE